MQVRLQQGMLPAGVIPIQGEELRRWAETLPTLQSLRNEYNLQRKTQDEQGAIQTLMSALQTYECTLIPVVARMPDGEIHNWMHVRSNLIADPSKREQALRDQEDCKHYIEQTLQHYDVRFEFVRDQSQQEGFSIQILVNW